MTLARRTLLGGIAAATIAPSSSVALAGCAAGAVVAPSAGAWLSEFALALSVDTAIEVLKYGSAVGVEKWENTLAERLPAERGWYLRKGYYRTLIAPALIVAFATVEQALDDDPAGCDVVVIVNKGRDGIRLPAWAWYTVSSFGNQFLADGRKKDRNTRAALLGYALTPTGNRKRQVTAPHKLVASVSYATSRGQYVEVAKVEQEDHSFTGYIKVSGVPDADNLPTVADFPLPADF